MNFIQTDQLKPIRTDLLTSEQVKVFRLLPYAQEDHYLYAYTDQSPTKAQHQEWRVLLGKSLQLTSIETPLFETLFSKHFYRSIAQEEQLRASDDVLEKILKTAHGLQSSDVHFEAFASSARVRFRLDGKLKTFYHLKLKDYPALINKIKIKAQLDISEKRMPQDGRISLTTQAGKQLDLRVSSLPTLHGEKLVLRILSRENQLQSLDQLGFTPADLLLFRQQLKSTQGLILLSGPTGAGKTTTLYAGLHELNQPATNILTIEDPIEYTLEGINQVQLNSGIGLTFPKALRSFLRQDPDIIMVGEIRDEATAQMAVRAALTGHLVLATLHTNSAWGSLGRLIDMQIPPFLLMETLRLSVAQRLVRRLCLNCAVVDSQWPKNITPPRGINRHKIAVGCNHCYHTGYSGRIALYEMFPMSDGLKLAFLEKKWTENQFQNHHPYKTLQQQAWRLIKDQISSIEELYPLLLI